MAPLIRTVFLAGLFFTLALSPPSNGAEKTAGTERAYLYEHPRLGYFIGIPVNVILQDRGDKRGIALKSRKGYQITVQTNVTNPEIDLQGMLFRLESKYLGNGKPWSRKFEQGKTRIAGLNAVEAMYEGSGAWVRVVIVRGARLDYVFIFLAPPPNFQRLVAEFDWVMASFRPAPGDRVATRAPAAGAQPLLQTLAAPDLGFTIGYPFEWVAERQGKYLVVISGKPGTADYFAAVSLQNVKAQDAQASPGAAITATLRGLKRQIVATDRQARFSDEGPYIYTRPGTRLNGGQFKVSYERDKTLYKQWTIVLPRKDEKVIHIWSYTTPAGQFRKYGEIARSILDSWNIDVGP